MIYFNIAVNASNSFERIYDSCGDWFKVLNWIIVNKEKDLKGEITEITERRKSIVRNNYSCHNDK